MKNDHFQSVSILVVVKNEAENLKKLIPILLNQQYQGLWDIHIVDDHSMASPLELWQDPAFNHSRLHLHRLPSDKAGKKQGLAYGLDKVTYDYVLLTDADCRPVSQNWLNLMQTALEDNEIVLGYSPYLQTNTFLNQTIRLETDYTALMYLSSALYGQGYMGVGRNLLYHKSIAVSSQNLQKHKSLLSGDDDLMVNELSHTYQFSIQIDPFSFVESIPKSTWKDWLKQKSRHVTTARHYQSVHIVFLILFYSTLILSWLLPAFLIGCWPWTMICFLLIKYIHFYIFKRLAVQILVQKYSFLTWLFAEGLYIVALIYLIPFGIFKKADKW